MIMTILALHAALSLLQQTGHRCTWHAIISSTGTNGSVAASRRTQHRMIPVAVCHMVGSEAGSRNQGSLSSSSGQATQRIIITDS